MMIYPWWQSDLLKMNKGGIQKGCIQIICMHPCGFKSDYLVRTMVKEDAQTVASLPVNLTSPMV